MQLSRSRVWRAIEKLQGNVEVGHGDGRLQGRQLSGRRGRSRNRAGHGDWAVRSDPGREAQRAQQRRAAASRTPSSWDPNSRAHVSLVSLPCLLPWISALIASDLILLSSPRRVSLAQPPLPRPSLLPLCSHDNLRDRKSPGPLEGSCAACLPITPKPILTNITPLFLIIMPLRTIRPLQCSSPLRQLAPSCRARRSR